MLSNVKFDVLGGTGGSATERSKRLTCKPLNFVYYHVYIRPIGELFHFKDICEFRRKTIK